MSALKDKLASPPARKYPNKVAAWRETLDDETRAAFDGAIRNPQWSNVALAKMLTASGFEVGAEAIRHYRERNA